MNIPTTVYAELTDIHGVAMNMDRVRVRWGELSVQITSDREAEPRFLMFYRSNTAKESLFYTRFKEQSIIRAGQRADITLHPVDWHEVRRKLLAEKKQKVLQ